MGGSGGADGCGASSRQWRWRLVRLAQPRPDPKGVVCCRASLGSLSVHPGAFILLVGTAIFGIPVAKSLSAGGMLDPTSESSQAAKLLSDKFGQGDMAMIISVTSDGGVESPTARAVGTDIVQRLQTSPHVGQMTSAWTTPSAPSLIGKDHRTGLIVAGISGSDNEAEKYAKQLADRLVHDRDGVTVRAGGEATIYWQIEAQTKKDLLLMESIAMPF